MCTFQPGPAALRCCAVPAAVIAILCSPGILLPQVLQLHMSLLMSTQGHLDRRLVVHGDENGLFPLWRHLSASDNTAVVPPLLAWAQARGQAMHRLLRLLCPALGQRARYQLQGTLARGYCSSVRRAPSTRPGSTQPACWTLPHCTHGPLDSQPALMHCLPACLTQQPARRWSWQWTAPLAALWPSRPWSCQLPGKTCPSW